MGMPSRKFLLLGVAGLGGLFVLADQTLLSKASAGLENLGGLASEVKKVQAIASSLESGDPAALQGLLDTLATDQGVTPGEAKPDLFGLGALMAGASATTPTDSVGDGSLDALLAGANPGSAAAGVPGAIPSAASAPQPDRSQARRVTMVMQTSGGGLAMVDGKPLRAGETRDGVTLIRVHEDGVTVREDDAERFLALR